MFFFRRSVLFSCVFCALFLLSACGSGGDDDGGEGNGVPASSEASIEISGGDVDRSYDLTATFATGTDPETGDSGFVLYFFSGDDPSQSSSFAYVARASERPGTGTVGTTPSAAAYAQPLPPSHVYSSVAARAAALSPRRRRTVTR